MPLTGNSGTIYQACLLDTNALSDIAKRPSVEGYGYLQRFPPDRYVPCLSIYSLFEIRQHSKVYTKFLDLFCNLPIVLLLPYRSILWAEMRSNHPLQLIDLVSYTFTPHVGTESLGLAHFIDHVFALPDIVSEEQNRLANARTVLKDWLEMKSNFTPSNEAPNAKDADRYVNAAYLHALAALDSSWMKVQLDSGIIPKVYQYPGLQVMLYSQYYRLFYKSWNARESDVTDIMISSCCPYVDSVVTEKFQASVLAKIKKKVRRLDSLEIAGLRCIRRKLSSD